MVFGGAFLLRALTESGTLSMAGGVWLGLAYALFWLALASRTRGFSGLAHGVSTVLIALPLTVEAALRFDYFSAAASATALAAVTMAVLVVASHLRSRSLAAIASAAAVVTAGALAVGFGAFVPVSMALMAVGMASLWIGYRRDWGWLAWPAAIAADLAVAALAVRTIADPPRESPVGALAVHAALIIGYLSTFVIRTLFHDRPVRTFEVVQTAAVVTIGLLGAVSIAGAHGIGAALIALPSLLVAAGLYAQTFTRMLSRFGASTEFYYTGMTALAFALVGLSLSFPFPVLPVVVAFCALVAIAVGWRWEHPMLALQGGIAAVVAAGQSGLIAFAARSWLTTAPVWPAHVLPMVFVLATVALALLIPPVARDPHSAMLSRAERLALSVALTAGLGSLVVASLTPVVAGAPPDAGVLATMRTTIAAGTAVLLAWLGRSPAFVEMRWLAYATLAIGAIKILAEDLPASRPATLFIALAVYGAALIAVPRIARSGQDDGAPAAGA